MSKIYEAGVRWIAENDETTSTDPVEMQDLISMTMTLIESLEISFLKESTPYSEAVLEDQPEDIKKSLRNIAIARAEAVGKACGLSLEVLEQIRSGEAVVIPTAHKKLPKFKIQNVMYSGLDGKIWTEFTDTAKAVQLNKPIASEKEGK